MPWGRWWFYRMVRATRRPERWSPEQIRSTFDAVDDPGWLVRLIEVSGWSCAEFLAAGAADSAWLVALDAEFGGNHG